MEFLQLKQMYQDLTKECEQAVGKVRRLQEKLDSIDVEVKAQMAEVRKEAERRVEKMRGERDAQINKNFIMQSHF